MSYSRSSRVGATQEPNRSRYGRLSPSRVFRVATDVIGKPKGEDTVTKSSLGNNLRDLFLERWIQSSAGKNSSFAKKRDHVGAAPRKSRGEKLPYTDIRVLFNPRQEMGMERIHGATIEATVVDLEPVREVGLPTGELGFHGEIRRVWTWPLADKGFIRHYRRPLREAAV
jgi:hypothetical protein